MRADTRAAHDGPPDDPALSSESESESGSDERAALRAAAVRRLELIDRLRGPALAGVTRLAAHLTGASAAAIHILDDRVQRLRSAPG